MSRTYGHLITVWNMRRWNMTKFHTATDLNGLQNKWHPTVFLCFKAINTCKKWRDTRIVFLDPQNVKNWNCTFSHAQGLKLQLRCPASECAWRFLACQMIVMHFNKHSGNFPFHHPVCALWFPPYDRCDSAALLGLRGNHLSMQNICAMNLNLFRCIEDNKTSL